MASAFSYVAERAARESRDGAPGNRRPVLAFRGHEDGTFQASWVNVADSRHVADRVVFMDEGVIVEGGPPAEVLENPSQERTQRFLSAVQHD